MTAAIAPMAVPIFPTTISETQSGISSSYTPSYVLPKSVTVDSTIERIALILLVVAQVMHEHSENRATAAQEERRRHVTDHTGALNTVTSIFFKACHVAFHALPIARSGAQHLAPAFVEWVRASVPVTSDMLDGAQNILRHIEQTHENSLAASRTASESEGHMARSDYERYGDHKSKAQSQADEAVRQIQEYNRANQEAMRSVAR